MKFLCVSCDRGMALESTRTGDDGELSVLFTCGTCGRQIAMLTNPMETQMVRSLGVRIGGGAPDRGPMPMVREFLAQGREQAPDSGPASEAASASPDAAETPASKCPFSDMINDALARGPVELTWTPEAQARISRIPDFAQPMVKQGVEMFARESGRTEITEEVIEQVKERFGM